MGTYLGILDFYDIALLFANLKTIAVAGYSPYPELAGHYVPHYLADNGFEVLAVNPRFGAQIDGLPCYPSLDAIPADKHVDVINVYRSAEFVPALVEQAAKLRPKPGCIWMHLGCENDLAAQRCLELGIAPVMHACMMTAHQLIHSDYQHIRELAGALPAMYPRSY